MKRGLWTISLATALYAMTAGAAHAHTGVGSANGFMLGFSHPIGGLDHVLAMIMVGLFAAQLGGRALWLVPVSFITTMVLGGLLGMTGIAVPFVELGIGLSVLVLGAVIALQMRPAVPVVIALVGFFAVFHGHAHGTEMPETAAGFAYGIGFVAASALLHASGIGLHQAIEAGSRKAKLMLVRSIGTAVAAVGLGLVSGIV